MTSEDDLRRQHLSGFLRQRREAVSPADVGLPEGTTRRRVVGLRREELAILAGVSPTWYTYLEQGRPITVSPQVLDSLARVLRLSEDERRYLHRLAYRHVVEPRPFEPAVAGDALRELVAALDTDLPVYAATSTADLVAWNDAFVDWYGGSCTDGEPPNLVVWLATDPGARERLVHWDDVGRETVARVRAAVADDPSFRDKTRWLAELVDANDVLRRWWDAGAVSERHTASRVLCHPEWGEREFRIHPFVPGSDPTVGVLFHVEVPADGRPDITLASR